MKNEEMKNEKVKNTERYGNNLVWAELPEGWGNFERVEIWEDIGQGKHQVICVASDKFRAARIIDLLIKEYEETLG